ncbi:MAG TPA: response regulator [Candidatus Limnocylindria bacterium]|nr:response regulator [Candidatus Limnocylindria bacterium]
MEKAVLIARDADERELLIELLADIGLETVVETAIPSVVTDPAVVLTDLGARYDPRKGRAAVRRLRERWPQAPVILLTSHRAAADESDQLGADALILKPFDVDDLTNAVYGLIARSETPERGPRLRLGA